VRNTRTGNLTCSTAIRLTQAEADALAALAQGNGCSRAALMRELVRDGLKPLLEG
jgi:predicted DNA-binding protein